jgi:hypothetical protein
VLQQVAVFDGYGNRALMEERLNTWLLAEPRHILSMQATEARLFIRWRRNGSAHRHSPVYFKLFNTLSNGSTPEARFKEFFEQHPTANIVLETCNEFFLFWLWADET